MNLKFPPLSGGVSQGLNDAGIEVSLFIAPDEQQIAQSKARDAKVLEDAKNALLATVPMPGEVNDYLLAHQNYSPRSRLQGVAPYVRTVSDFARPR